MEKGKEGSHTLDDTVPGTGSEGMDDRTWQEGTLKDRSGWIEDRKQIRDSLFHSFGNIISTLTLDYETLSRQSRILENRPWPLMAWISFLPFTFYGTHVTHTLQMSL